MVLEQIANLSAVNNGFSVRVRVAPPSLRKANQFGTETTWKVVRLYENMDRVRFPSFPPEFIESRDRGDQVVY